ncbi:MAG: AMP-dependent synthetase [Myxococcales bacterium]|nr:AMP-dependent synthetase [Myxococcales bacterium]
MGPIPRPLRPMPSLPTWMKAVARAARAEVMLARVSAQVMHKTGVIGAITAAGFGALVKNRGKTNPATMLRYHAHNTPHRTALIHASVNAIGDRAYSFFELDERIARYAASLTGLGIGRGDRVLLLLKNVPEFIMLQHALSRLGAQAVTVSWRSTAPELAFLLENSGARALFFDADSVDVTRRAIGEGSAKLGDRIFSVRGKLDGFRAIEELAEAAPAELDVPSSEDAAVVIYTSGTTGKPKGAVRKYSRKASLPVLSFIAETPLRVGQTHLAVCPLYHSTAYAFVNLAHSLGNTVVLLESFEPTAFLDAVERFGVHHTALVPTMLHRTLELGSEVLGRRDLSSLVAIFTGGAPLPPAVATRAMDAFGDKLYNFYGATETGIVTLATPRDLRAAPDSIGRAVPGNEIVLFGDDGQPVRRGEVGELYVRTANLVVGYHGNDAATRASMKEDFFSVGDLARVDDNGRYFLEGRKHDMIISGGVNVYPREVESALSAHPAVAEAAVVGIPDLEWGERVHAVVELRAGHTCTEAELLAFLRERLAGPKRPRAVTIVDCLPRNPTGKVLKRELRTQLTP